MAKKQSVRAAARTARSEDSKVRKSAGIPQLEPGKMPTLDSFTNFQFKMGMGADNPLSSASYGFNPITRVRILLEWIHRGSWIGGVAVDVHADDMTREGIEIKGITTPEDMERIQENATTLRIWQALRDTVAWSRLYGGAIAVMLIDGQDMRTPLNLDRIGKGAFRGLLVLDRWMVEPSLGDLVTEMGPNLGLPKFYRVTTDAPALPKVTIHHSRCIRLEGIRLPYYQRLQENMWGLSVLERVYDRMVAFDSATTGAAQLVYKSYLRVMKIEGLRDNIAGGNDMQNALVRYMELVRRFQSVEGMTLIDGNDEFSEHGSTAFGGLADSLAQFGQQLSGALQIPLVRLFGQSPTGFSTGDTDLKNYYDGIKKDQERDLKVGVTKIYRAIAQSEGIQLPEGFSIKFKPLWQLTDADKATVAGNVVNAVSTAESAGFISKSGAMRELRQSSEITGIFSNIKDEDIDAAEALGPPEPEITRGLSTNEPVAGSTRPDSEVPSKPGTATHPETPGGGPSPSKGGGPAASPSSLPTGS